MVSENIGVIVAIPGRGNPNDSYYSRFISINSLEKRGVQTPGSNVSTHDVPKELECVQVDKGGATSERRHPDVLH